ncbi:DUF3263 domain-containing protein [Gordonia sp. (in: high G+C Gram-positive bacteria)]|jgi:hypothetical protein|uniref:DUF3263 domain-containing protein n=1 Tax=Gordonia sp. (in: high G+C Gram-positive bacteria) TaxID=84139 RepID=UPI001E153351|nr:DUF3263 domain-containing protein [Gordonia sp. (in: high G+C Gram-positive bacteria)]MCB1294085.1 DUF3263 domain-containing protein [Gordonia sp. (in: high G+C Gram-positive bacteria)]HMS77435.1 DUF3263 domain-containing protein [Gordonia sp. (in: high G+C Gram-positive bacteria)]HQV20495.1 DUF3263 domain-containing protein [Gordonia sp. (in: high G+C Gram-positive bacteria)]
MDNPTHQKMLAFETDWYPLGGGSSVAIREQFGLSDRDFFGEVDRLIEVAPPEKLTTAELDRMRKVVRRRLWMAR